MSNSSSKSRIGFTDLLTIVFVVLKLCNVIDWSWWWVISPTLVTIVLNVIISVLNEK